MSDGLTVPFALATGVNANSIILTAGLAEIAAGSIAMGLGGFYDAFGVRLGEAGSKKCGNERDNHCGGLHYGWSYPIKFIFFIPNTKSALLVSAIETSTALFIFGYIKERFTDTRPLRRAFQTTLIGGWLPRTLFLIASAMGKVS
jgi:hypothetical protein